MKKLFIIAITACVLFSCDQDRVYEKNEDFSDRIWLVNNKPSFEFEIKDDQQPYNIYCNVRNGVAYPYSRIFITYYLQDSVGTQLQKKLIDHTLFDPKTGKPAGESGLGDIYDHRILLMQNHRFDYAGKHKIQLEQFMRVDSLQGVLAVGIRIEKASKEN